MTRTFLALAAAGLLGLTAAGAGAAQLSQQDTKFMKQAAAGGMGEVQSGQLAEQRGASPAIKDLGQTLVADHTRLNQQLTEMAQQQGRDAAAEHRSLRPPADDAAREA